MKRCLALSARYSGETAPNPIVGALVVKDGKVVGKGVHVRAGLEHAEIVALRQAGEKAKGATLFVTLEPCNHQGQTGPCSEAIVRAGIKKVVFGLSDPNPLACGGANYLRGKGIEVVGGVLSEQVQNFLEPWLFLIKNKRPMRELLAVVSLDGSLISHVPRLTRKYFKNIPNLHSDSGKAIFEKGEFDRIVLVRTTHDNSDGTNWPFGTLSLTLQRSWAVGDLSFSIYVKEASKQKG